MLSRNESCPSKNCAPLRGSELPVPGSVCLIWIKVLWYPGVLWMTEHDSFMKRQEENVIGNCVSEEKALWYMPGSTWRARLRCKFNFLNVLFPRWLTGTALPTSPSLSPPSCVSCLLCWQTGSVPLAPPGKPLWVPYNHSNFTSSCSHKRDQNVCLHKDLYTNGHNSIFDTIPKLGTTQMTTSRWMDQQSSHQPISLLKNATTWRNLNYHSVQKGLLLLLNRFGRVRLCVTP